MVQTISQSAETSQKPETGQSAETSQSAESIDQAQAMCKDKVWVAYATPDAQFYLTVDYQAGMTVADAIERSGLRNLTSVPEALSYGIFSVKVHDLDHVLQPGDRVELYRALRINPKEIRRKRAAANPVGRYCRGNRFKQLK